MTGIIVSGIVTGLLYALCGLGLAVTYRTTKVLNFCVAGLGAVAGYIVFVTSDAPYPLAVLCGVLAGATGGLVLDFLVARPLRYSSVDSLAIGTLGALLVAEGALGAIFGYSSRALRQPIINAGTFHLGDVGVSANQGIIAIVGVGISGLVAWSVLRTRIGLSMRAVSSGPQTAALLGINVNYVRSYSWVLGGGLSGLAAILVIPQTFLSPTSFTNFLLITFVAVVLGGFTSVRGIVIGAVLYGVALDAAETYLSTGYPFTYSLITVALLLLVKPYGLFGSEERNTVEPAIPLSRHRLRSVMTNVRSAVGSATYTSRRRYSIGVSESSDRVIKRRRSLHVAGYMVTLALLVSFRWTMSPSMLLIAGSTLLTFIAVVGLDIIAGHVGKISIGHSAFVAIGAYSVAEIVSRTSLGLVWAIIIAVGVAGIMGVVVMIPIMRLSELYFALVTLLVAAAAPEIATQLQSLTGGSSGMSVNAPAWIQDPVRRYWLALACAVGVGAIVLALIQARVGRNWRAVRDSSAASRSLGVSPALVTMGAFALGSALAGLSGGLVATYTGFISPDSYGVFPAIYLVMAVVVGGRSSVMGSLIGAAFITFLPHYIPTSVTSDVLYGVIVVAVLAISPNGIVELGRRLLDFLAMISRQRPANQRGLDIESTTVSHQPTDRADDWPFGDDSRVIVETPIGSNNSDGCDVDGGLRIVSATTGYGRGMVLQNVSLAVGPQEIVALLGPNGAGKTTLLRAISQLLPLTGGTVTWEGQRLHAHHGGTPHRAARLGICHVPEGRQIFPDLSVTQNLELGTRARRARGLSGTATSDDDLERVLDLFPRLKERYRQRAGTLSGGEQQMLAIGRGLMGAPSLLLLDEPSLGLAPVIVEQLFDTFNEIRSRGTAILLVEQNAAVALEAADRGYVLRNGHVVQQGKSRELRDDPRLVSSYLGVAK